MGNRKNKDKSISISINEYIENSNLTNDEKEKITVLLNAIGDNEIMYKKCNTMMATNIIFKRIGYIAVGLTAYQLIRNEYNPFLLVPITLAVPMCNNLQRRIDEKEFDCLGGSITKFQLRKYKIKIHIIQASIITGNTILAYNLIKSNMSNLPIVISAFSLIPAISAIKNNIEDYHYELIDRDTEFLKLLGEYHQFEESHMNKIKKL